MGAWLSSVIFGAVEFSEDEQYTAFRFRFLVIVLWFAALCTALVVVGHYSGANPIGSVHPIVATGFTVACAGLALALRGHRERFLSIGIAAAVACFVEYGSAFLFVPTDELRILWFVLHIPTVYIILGRAAGAINTGATIVFVLVTSPLSAAPLSPNATVTFTLGVLVGSAIYFAHTSRTRSAFRSLADLNGRLRDQASHDPLTGLLNARAFYEAADHLIKLALRSETVYSVLFVDLDHFKRVNDEHGHEAGDTVLRTIADVLRRNARRSDLVGRIGGEEFAVFLPDTSMTGAMGLGEYLRASIEQAMPTIEDGASLRVTASIGVAGRQPEHSSIADILRQSDQAMYDAKRRGRNRVASLHGGAPQMQV
jgi:diguanylate cyclase (GGDEF)-like protein